ncbi:MAG: recombinase family protein, partial [Dehalococcoidia bacterium]
MPVRCVIYSRVSTDAQERDGTSLDTQERGCVELAASRGWSVVRCIRDAASGFHLEREGVETLRGMLRRGEVDVVIAYAVDRLSRNQNHIGVLIDEVEQAGARLEFATERFEDTAVGRFILAARAFIAEVEREKIVERTTRGKAERARSGRLPQGTGRGIFGYHYDQESGTRSIEAGQSRVVVRLFEDFVAGRSCNRLA